MKILKLEVENVKRLVAVEIEPDGRVIRLTGKNGAGKSSVIDAIWMACGGKDVVPEVPIRRGEDAAKVQLTLDDGLIITRTFTEKGSYLNVSQGEGMDFRSPQKMLDSLIGRLSFDPLAFTIATPAKQLETLRELSGIDTRDVEFEVAQLFEARAGANKAVKQQKALADDAKSRLPDDCPTEEVSLAEIVDELEQARIHNVDNEAERSTLDGLHGDASEAEDSIIDLNKQIAELEEEKKGHESVLAEATEAISKAEKRVKELEDVDLAPIQERLKGAESENDKARAHQAWTAAWTAMNAEVGGLEKAASDLTDKLEQARQKKADMIAKGNMPIPGLSFGAGEVMYNELPFEQASAAEQMRVSMAIAMAMNPKLKVVCIRDGSLLDSTSLKIVSELVEEHDFQLWLEQVDESGEVGVYIEDGMVVSVDGEPQT